MTLLLINLIACALVAWRALLDINAVHITSWPALADLMQIARMAPLCLGALASATAPLFGYALTTPAVVFAVAVAVVVVTYRNEDQTPCS